MLIPECTTALSSRCILPLCENAFRIHPSERFVLPMTRPKVCNTRMLRDVYGLTGELPPAHSELVERGFSMTTRDARGPTAHPEIILATVEQESIVANLLELYIHDFTEFLPLEIGPDGRFGYRNLSRYWHEAGHYPFLVRMDGNWAGLVFVTRGSAVSGDESVWDMAEFFVLRRHRRRGIGTEIAHEVWRRFPGRWEVRVLDSNEPARIFWERALERFTGEVIGSIGVQRGAQYWHLFSFESKGNR